MSKISRSAVLISALFACGNPDSKVDAPVESTPAPASQPAPKAETPPAPKEEPAPPGEGALPVPEDFEAEAEATITKDSYKKELAALDEEIKADDKAEPAAKAPTKPPAKPK